MAEYWADDGSEGGVVVSKDFKEKVVVAFEMIHQIVHYMPNDVFQSFIIMNIFINL